MADIHSQSLPLPKFPMSAFDLGHVRKLCLRPGQFANHYVEECIPSDIAHIKTDIFMRLDPLVFPVMHRIKIRQNFFFVPTRLILGDSKQEEFFSMKDMSAKLPSYRVPYSVADNILGSNTMFDQMECQPVKSKSGSGYFIVRNPIPFLGMQLIYKDWYADEILDANVIDNIEGLIAQYQLTSFNTSIIANNNSNHPFRERQVSYSKDRFTSAQPDAQRVGEVYLMNPLTLERTDGNPISGANLIGVNTDGSSYINTSSEGYPKVRPTLTIDELWDEMVVQRFLNSMNEFGNERYTEILAGQFGVISADARLQRPQWLGGNEMVVNISEVLQTSESTLNNPLGSLAGRGIVSGRGRDIVFKVPEHGYILGVLTIVPENGYASGSPRWLYKETPLDFAFPRFNNLGEQAVLNGELFSDHEEDSITNDKGEFGYQPRFDEYRSHPSRSTGDFRENPFLSWHLDRKFTSVPPLNSGFIHVDYAENNRIFNDTDPDAYHFRALVFHKNMFVRPISRHPVPGKL